MNPTSNEAIVENNPNKYTYISIPGVTIREYSTPCPDCGKEILVCPCCGGKISFHVEDNERQLVVKIGPDGQMYRSTWRVKLGFRRYSKHRCRKAGKKGGWGY